MGGNSLDKYNGLWVVNLVAFEMGLTLRFFLPRQQGVGVGTTLCKVVMISDVRYLCDSNVDVSLRKHNNVRWSTGSQGSGRLIYVLNFLCAHQSRELLYMHPHSYAEE